MGHCTESQGSEEFKSVVNDKDVKTKAFLTAFSLKFNYDTFVQMTGSSSQLALVGIVSAITSTNRS